MNLSVLILIILSRLPTLKMLQEAIRLLPLHIVTALVSKVTHKYPVMEDLISDANGIAMYADVNNVPEDIIIFNPKE